MINVPRIRKIQCFNRFTVLNRQTCKSAMKNKEEKIAFNFRRGQRPAPVVPICVKRKNVLQAAAKVLF